MNNEFKKVPGNLKAQKVVSAQIFNSLLNIHMNYTIKSENQSGGTTAGQVNNRNINVSQYIWQGRKEGFFSALCLGIIVEIIIRIIFN